MARTEKLLHRLDLDPAVGVGLVILGVLVMGVSGAATWHYAFNAGTGIAILGAILFVLSVTLSTLRDKSSEPSGRSKA
jgi:hypothetical protein